jgi:hypothetical protein
MGEQIEKSIVRIWDTAIAKIVGAGVLVHANHVLTCARVVATALGFHEVPAEMPRAAVHLDFLSAAGYILTASPFLWRPPRADDKSKDSDIAGLALEGRLPDEAVAARIVITHLLSGHGFDVCGFPGGQPNGVWISGILRGEAADGLIQMDGVTQPNCAVPQGFCGAPVWDKQLSGVVGLMVVGDRSSQSQTPFMIPGHVLCTLWPELSDACRQHNPVADSWQAFFGMPWSHFANLADALIILDSESEKAIAPLEENLSTILDFIGREPVMEEWAPLLESLTNFSQYSSSARSNQSSVKALCQVVRELFGKLAARLSPGRLPPSIAEKLEDLAGELSAC